MVERSTHQGADEIGTVSVVIPTRDRRASLDRILASLLGERGLKEVIVVDDGSADDTAAHVQALAGEFPALRLIRTSGVGPSLARAAGAAAATGEVVLFVDDDVVGVPGFVEGHARWHRDDENLIVCGYSPPVVSGRSSAVVRNLAHHYGAWVEAATADSTQALFELWGLNMSIRRVDVRRVPPSVPEFEGCRSHEDREFGLRCLEAGMRGIVDVRLRADHFYTRTIKQFRLDMLEFGRGRVLLHHLHGDILGPFSGDVLEPAARRFAAAIRVTDKPAWYRVITAALEAGVRLGDAARMPRLADWCLHGLARIELRRGARVQAARLEAEVGFSGRAL